MAPSIRIQIANASAEHSGLLRKLSKTKDSNETSEELITLINELKIQLASSAEKLQKLGANRQNESRTRRNSNTRRLFYAAVGQKNKFSVRQEKEEKTYVEAMQAEQAAQKQSEGLTLALEEALDAQKLLDSTVATNHKAQRRLEELYEEIFAGPTPEFPEEDELERRMKRSLEAYQGICARRDTLVHRVDCVEKAMKQAENVLLELTRARVAFKGLRTSEDAMTRVEACNKRAAEAAKQAHTHTSEAGLKKAPRVPISDNSFLGEMFSTEAAFHSGIRQAQLEVGQLSDFLTSELHGLKKQLPSVKGKLQTTSRELKTSQDVLFEMRRRIFESVMKGATHQSYKK